MNQPRPPGRIFYGWYVVAAALLGNFMSSGIGFYVFNAFLLPLNETRGWSRADLNLAPMIGFMCGLLAQFAYGSVLHRVGPRRFMTMGPILAGSAFIMLGWAESLPWFIFWYVCMMIGNGAFTGLVSNSLVTNWFEARRGRALGLATVGISLSGVVLPPLAAWLIQDFGLQAAFWVIGGTMLLMSPVSFLVVRDDPAQMGLLPEGGAPHASWGAGDATERHRLEQIIWTPALLAKSGVFWKVGLSFGLVLAGVMGVLYQLAPHLMDRGLSPEAALGLVSLAAALGAGGKYFWGHLCDRYEPRMMVAWLMGCVGLSLVLGLLHWGLVGAVAFVSLFGLGMGGLLSTFPIITAHLYGRRAFAPVFRFLVLFQIIQALGYLVMGRTYNWLGSYDAALGLFAAVDLGAVLLILSLPNRVGAPAAPILGPEKT